MNVRHQPADRILHEQQRNDEPVEQLGGGPVLQTIGHDFPTGQEFIVDPTTIGPMPVLFQRGIDFSSAIGGGAAAQIQ
jgi:hypothetical protein